MVHRISVAEHAKRKRSAIHQNLHRPKRTRTDHTFAAVLNAVLGFRTQRWAISVGWPMRQ